MASLIATWGVACVLALLGQALWRLTPLALEPWLEGSMSPLQQALYVGWAAIMAYSEGYRGFQKKFSPRVVARAFYLGRHPTPLRVALALPFCMSFFHSTRRQMIVSYTFVTLIALLVVAVRSLPQPWRGIVDGGVVVGLGWGVVAIVVFYVRGLLGQPPPVTDLPPKAAPASAPAAT